MIHSQFLPASMGGVQVVSEVVKALLQIDFCWFIWYLWFKFESVFAEDGFKWVYVMLESKKATRYVFYVYLMIINLESYLSLKLILNL